MIFFAGVKKIGNTLVNSGGRVLGVTVKCDDIDGARELAYENIHSINFTGSHWRTDIGLGR